MDKRVRPSSLPYRISKQRLMKRSTLIRKNKKNTKHTRKHYFYFEKVVSYLLSDSYMYNPLVSPQPTFDFPPPKQIVSTPPPPGCQNDAALPVKGTNRKIAKLVDFLEADCYLYAPLLTNQHASSENHPVTPGSGVLLD